MSSQPESFLWPAGIAPSVDSPALPAADSVAPAKAKTKGSRRAQTLELARTFLGSRRATWAIVGLALLLTSVALSLELTADDHFHVLALRGDSTVQGLERAPWDLFAFAKNPELNQKLIEEGVFPWWSDPNTVIAFLRPIASLTHWLDHRLWPDLPVLMHLHSLLWFAALLLVIGHIYRELAPTRWLAGFALLLYAVDDARAMTVGWISNRNALVALVPAFGALAAHHAWRTRRQNRYAVLALVCLILGLFSAEAALQAVGYLGAYALCLESGPWLKRLRTLVPYVLVVIAWRAVYVSLGYGALGSAFYIDPGRSPLLFAQHLVQRLPVLLLGELAMPFADFWDGYPVFAPIMRSVVPLMGLLAIGVFGWLLRPLWGADARVRFWTVGTVLATLPACGASPTDRLLTATGVGGAALIATLLSSVVERTYPNLRRPHLVLAGGLALIHLGMAPLLLVVRTKSVDVMEALIARAASSIDDSAEVAKKTVVILNPPAEPFAGYFPLYRESKRIARPAHFRWLSTGLTALDVTRLDARSLEVRPEGGFLANDIQWLLRTREKRFQVGQRVELSDVSYEVVEITPDGRPAAMVARFAQPLENENLEFMQWGEHEYVPFRLPAIGQRVHVPGIDVMSAMLGQG